MLANRLAKYAALRGIYYGWVMAALAFFYVLFSSSALGITAVLIKPMSDQLGLTIGELSASQGLRFALFGLAAPFAGGLMLRYGPRRMVALSGVLSLLGLLLTATMTTRFQLWLGFGALLGLAPGLTALQLSAVISSRWFTTHRGLVVGVLNGAIATGTLVFMPLGAWISEQWGWRAALVPSSIGLFVMMVLFVLLTKDRPQELGLAPLGEASMPPVPPAAHRQFRAAEFESPPSWVGAVGVLGAGGHLLLCGLSSYGLTQTHFVPYCGDLGFPLVTSASLLAMIGVCDLIGTIGSGWLSDRYDNRWLLAIYYGLRGVSLVWLVTSNVSLVAMIAFTVIYGLDFIATVPPTVRFTVAAFGREMGPAVFGWIFAAHQLARPIRESAVFDPIDVAAHLL